MNTGGVKLHIKLTCKFITAVKYLGIYVVAAKCFKLSIDHLKVKFYRVFNCIYHKAKAPNSELVIVQLLFTFSPVYLGMEAVSQYRTFIR